MRVALRVVLLVAALVILALLLVGIASESGEVVVLRTEDASGARHETRLWIAEIDGVPYLRAGQPDSAWLARIRERPEVELRRSDTDERLLAAPDPAARDVVNAAMADKYGWADRWIDLVFGRDDAVPVRLEPLGALRDTEDSGAGGAAATSPRAREAVR